MGQKVIKNNYLTVYKDFLSQSCITSAILLSFMLAFCPFMLPQAKADVLESNAEVGMGIAVSKAEQSAVSLPQKEVAVIPVARWQSQDLGGQTNFYNDLVAVFDGIKNKYFGKAELDIITANALAEVTKSDKNISVGYKQGGTIIITYNGEIISSIAYKNQDSPALWAEKILSAFSRLKEHSLVVRGLNTEELYTLFFTGLLSSLDNFSKYIAPDKAIQKKNAHVGSNIPEENGLKVKNVGQNKEIIVIIMPSFNIGTEKEVVNIIKNLPSVTEKLVFDLRGNNGGVLAEAIRLADDFLKAGVIADVKGYSEASKKLYIADEEVIWDKPVIILTDENTRSAAEVFTAALKDNKRAVVKGRRTFGKGLIQTPIPLSNKGEVMLSWATVVMPNGKELNKQGVEPDELRY